MTAIWLEQDSGAWSQQPAARYENEQALHDMIMSTPELLPLSGSPELTVIGREVGLPSSGYADVLAVEPDGRPVIIEVKLKNNAESRRAVVAQTLSYAASLHGLTRQELEETVLSKHLQGQSLFDRVRESIQDETLAQSDFEEGLEAHLAAGSFRAVIVLDEAPAELINLMGYLEAVTTGLSLDLIVVTSYRIGDRRIAVPQRLDPERRPEVPSARPTAIRSTRLATSGRIEPGVQPFRELVASSSPEYQAVLTAMADWAEELTATNPAINAKTYFGVQGDVTLLPRFADQNAGLVTLWRNHDGRPSISFWRSVFLRRAPQFIERVENVIAPKTIGRGNTTDLVTPELLAVLREAYLAGATTADANTAASI